MKYIIASSKDWGLLPTLKKILPREGQWFFVEDKKELTIENIRSIEPRYIFFPHWSYIIPEEIYSNFECVIFHMTDVPFGRGGSPLQNLISRGIYETKLTALRCVRELDAGPVYTKRGLTLYGNAEEIYIRASKLSWEIIKWIVETEPIPKKQIGEPVFFSRRKPKDSNISCLENIAQVFDYIRMLDAEGYPPAFLMTDFFKIEFSRASFKNGHVLADVKITMRDENEKDQ
ncbi:MAG: methionyl-tRNA formyltransferase [Bacteroidia bacterium]|nr:methionyl-tRNA formyltransferase [Bacteroidia bacterium]